MRNLGLLGIVMGSLTVLASPARGEEDLPSVPDGFVVDVVAREPLVGNPCVMAFDRRGRICVAQGPQWRAPTPQTPGDRVDILLDRDGDGIADDRKTFAEGFNSVQGIAWHGNDLWVANAPDLTVVRDTDGDDQADVYFRVYTGLGNLEHSLHGLAFGPDGKLYMSKGNSKGYNRLDQLAPRAFRELWATPGPAGAPDYTPVESFSRDSYQRRHHTPADDWGRQGGVLRCDPYPPLTRGAKRVAQPDPWGRNLEILSRGFRNPWDIGFDNTFTWLGTDNDQTQGDRIFSPFFGAHFGWGHAWSYHWAGETHLPTVPNSAPLFEGSGTGVVFAASKQFPPEYRGVFFVGDWLQRKVYAFRPKWNGALLECETGFPTTFAAAGSGRSLPSSQGVVFDPTDLEIGPDGALYVLSWGHGYGATLKEGLQQDAGRVYRIRYAAAQPTAMAGSRRATPGADWSLDALLADLGSSVPAWRVNAQQELLRRGQPAMAFLRKQIASESLSKAQETWAVWTLARGATRVESDEPIAVSSGDELSLNRRIQALRIAAWLARRRSSTVAPPFLLQATRAAEARVRHQAVLGLHQMGARESVPELLRLVQREEDRVVFYSAWRALADLGNRAARVSWLEHSEPNVRLAALLGLLEEEQVDVELVVARQNDEDRRVAELAGRWLEETGAVEPIVNFTPPPGEYAQPQQVMAKSSAPGTFLTYTVDGSRPTLTSPRWTRPISLHQTTTIRVAIHAGATGNSRYGSAKYVIRRTEPYRHRPFVQDVRAPSGRDYELDWTGLAPGKRHYTDRDYVILENASAACRRAVSASGQRRRPQHRKSVAHVSTDRALPRFDWRRRPQQCSVAVDEDRSTEWIRRHGLGTEDNRSRVPHLRQAV